MTDFTNRTIDSQVDAATGDIPYAERATGTPIADAPDTTRQPIERSTHNPDNRLQGGPGMFHALRGFAKAYTE